MTRQLAVLERLKRRIEVAPALDGAMILGSLARGDGDELSDVDLIVVVAEGRFEDAWRARHDLHGGEALVAWDDVEPERAEVAGFKWLTRDLVLVECLLATGSSGVRLAEPFRVVVGAETLVDRLQQRPPIAREELERFAQMRIETGRAHEVETAYDELAKAVRRARATGGSHPQPPPSQGMTRG